MARRLRIPRSKVSRPGGCTRCGRRLKRPSASGMGPSCERKHAEAAAKTERKEAEGQLAMFEERKGA